MRTIHSEHMLVKSFVTVFGTIFALGIGLAEAIFYCLYFVGVYLVSAPFMRMFAGARNMPRGGTASSTPRRLSSTHTAR